MANLLEEDLVRFTAGIRSLPGRPHVSTGYRFITRGCRGVFLESILVGGRRFTSRQALLRFVDAVTAAASRNGSRPSEQSTVGPIVDGGLENDLDKAGL